MQLEIETLEKECDRIIDEYLAQDIPKNHLDHLFGRQLDYVDYQQKFSQQSSQEMIDYSNMILAEYKDDDDVDVLKERLTEVLQSKLREGLKKIFDDKL